MQTSQTQVKSRRAAYTKSGMGFLSITLAALILMVAGCNGSGSASSPLNGTFIDSAVEGMNYQTHDASGMVTGTGTTDADGTFVYHDGDMVQFMIGDVVLGEAQAKDVVTPLDLADTAGGAPVDLNNQMVTNMGRFLQSLDADGNPENGITIAPDVSQEVSGRMIDFNMPVDDFETDPDVTAMFDAMNALGMPYNGGTAGGMISVEQARAHMQEHMGSYMTGMMGTGDDSDSGQGMMGLNGDNGSPMMNWDDNAGMDNSTGTGDDVDMISDGNAMIGDMMGAGDDSGYGQDMTDQNDNGSPMMNWDDNAGMNYSSGTGDDVDMGSGGNSMGGGMMGGMGN